MRCLTAIDEGVERREKTRPVQFTDRLRDPVTLHLLPRRELDLVEVAEPVGDRRQRRKEAMRRGLLVRREGEQVIGTLEAS